MKTYSYDRIEMPEIGVLRYNMIGLERSAETEIGQKLLHDRLKAEPQWTGVLFDYSCSEISYTLAEFSKHVQCMIQNFPRRVKLAYVYSPLTLVVLARASKLLSSSGIKAQAFPIAEEALAFLSCNENWVRRG